MEVLVTGATGFVGRRLCAALAARGDRIRVLSRDPSRARLPDASAAFAWEPLAGPPPPQALEGLDAVVHLAGESVSGRWTDERRRAIRDSRVLGTENLLRGLAGRQSLRLVSASAIGYYGDRGDEVLDEQAAPGEDFLAQVCRDWEQAAAAHGGPVAMARIAVVLGHGGGALDRLLPLFRAGLGGRLGHGRQWWSWVHVDDLVAGLLFLLDGTLTGPVNLSAPSPLRQRDFARALGAALSRPALLPTPAFGLKAALGGFAAELLASRRVVPARLEAEGFRFRCGTVEEALGDLTR